MLESWKIQIKRLVIYYTPRYFAFLPKYLPYLGTYPSMCYIVGKRTRSRNVGVGSPSHPRASPPCYIISRNRLFSYTSFFLCFLFMFLFLSRLLFSLSRTGSDGRNRYPIAIHFFPFLFNARRHAREAPSNEKEISMARAEEGGLFIGRWLQNEK